MVEADTTRHFHRDGWAEHGDDKSLGDANLPVEFRMYRISVRINGDASERCSFEPVGSGNTCQGSRMCWSILAAWKSVQHG